MSVAARVDVAPEARAQSPDLAPERRPPDDLVLVDRATRVLVALEQPLFAEVLRVALDQRPGYEVVGRCSSLGDLRAEVERCRPDVVLMDVVSEHHDGVAVLSELRRAVPRTAVLVLSAALDAPLLSDVMSAGAAGFLSFQADVTEVVDAVSAAAQGQVVLSGRRLEALVRHLSARGAAGPPCGPGGRLTDREAEVLRLLASGTSTVEIARRMFISAHTARTHVQHVLMKLGVHSRLEAAAYAVRHGMVSSA
jgi:DNA-binding NarL/FixJ family response regulator